MLSRLMNKIRKYTIGDSNKELIIKIQRDLNKNEGPGFDTITEEESLGRSLLSDNMNMTMKSDSSHGTI